MAPNEPQQDPRPEAGAAPAPGRQNPDGSVATPATAHPEAAANPAQTQAAGPRPTGQVAQAGGQGPAPAAAGSGASGGGGEFPPHPLGAAEPDPEPAPDSHLLGTAPTNPYRPDTPANDFIHGVKGKFAYKLVGDTIPTVFDIEQVSADFRVESDDITNTSSNGARVRLDGIEEVTGQVSFVYDSLHVPSVAPLPFRPRTYATLLIKPDGVTVYQFVALIMSFSFSTGPKVGTVRVTANYESTGPIIYPSTSLLTATNPLNGST